MLDPRSEPLRARFWNFLRTAPANAHPAHHAIVTIDSVQRMDVPALERAITDVIASYPALRGRLTTSDIVPAISGQDAVLREVVADDEATAAAALAAHATDAVGAGGKPLFAALLVTLPERSVLELVTHQLVCDQASLVTVAEELATRYDNHLVPASTSVTNKAAVLAQEPAAGDDSPTASVYEELREIPLDVALPGMRPRRAVPEYGFARHRVDLRQDLADGVRTTAARLGVATETVYLTAFRTLLHRIARQDAVLVMTELDRRPPRGAPGCWTDLVPLALTGARGMRFADLVNATSRQLDQARVRPAVEVPDLANRLHQDPTGISSTLGRVSFTARPADLVLPVADGTWTCRVVDPPVSEFDLSLVLRDNGDAGCTVSFVYDPDLLPEWAVATIARSFVQLLGSATANPDGVVIDLDIVDPADRRMLLEEWNGRPDPVPVTMPVPKVFEVHAVQQPDANAVYDRGVSYTYAQVNAWANQVAHALIAGGVRKGDVVGLYIPRSVEWVVAYLAAHKAGAVVVALDPGSPRSRLEAALAASPPTAIITPSEATNTTALGDIAITRVDIRSTVVERMSTRNPDVPIELDDIAYVVQTSGSTGRPRAVFGPHRAHAHLCLEMAAVMRIGPGSRTSWLVDAAAGISMSLVWRALSAGATLYIATDDELVSSVELRNWHLKHELSHTFVTTQLAEPLTGLDWPDDGTLTVMEVGGEKVRRWPSAELPFDVIVAYGSNEAFMVTSMLFPWEQRMTARTATQDDLRLPPPVGRPLPGVHTYVVDADLRLLPPGVVGEVCVDSPEVMFGYLGDPAETARRVRPNPFGPPGSRLLWTGDIGSIRHDGLLELTGRLDDMVKVRGFRVEPAAIEAELVGHPAVRSAAVVPVADAAGHNQLVACVVADAPLAPEVLRAYLLDRLPAYMVPIAYVPMERLPTGVLNKIDRKQLPPEDWSTYRARATYRAPASAEEEVLTRIWADVLEADGIGVDDNLLELGGSSLHVGRVQVRISEQLGVEVSIRQIFEAPTPSAIAATIRLGHAPRRRQLPPLVSRRARS